MIEYFIKATALLVPLTIAIVFHEVAHGWVARLFGDPTASSQGRLSLNPIKHVDPVGTLALPMMLALASAPIFGWAKPVPINPARLRNPRWHMVLVAAAGPAINLVLAFAAVWAMVMLIPGLATNGGEGRTAGFLFQNLNNFLAINLFLAVFNMIPMPPFDGSRVLAGFLPDGWRARWEGLDRYGLLVMIGLLVILPTVAPSANLISYIVVPPVDWLMEHMVGLASFIA